MIELIYKSLKGAFNKGIRTFLTLLGIAVGVAAVIIILNISQCGSDAITNEIEGLGMGGLSISLKNDDAPLTKNELENIQKLSYVDYAMPLIFETTNISLHGNNDDIYLWGIDQSAEKTISLKLIYGRFLNSGDIASSAKNCIVDQKFAINNYGTDNIVGKKIDIVSGSTNTQYNIVGIIKTGSGLLQNIMGSYIPNFIYIPYTTMQSNLSSNNFSQIIVKIKNNISYEEAEEEVIRNIERITNINDAYIVTNLAKQKESLNNVLNIFTIVLSCIGSVSIFVAGLSIMNVMLVSVAERTKEIGIKKAIGASKYFVIIEFLAESATISFIGCIIGIILGISISYFGAMILGLKIIFKNGIIIVLILLLSNLVGIVFGIYPAIKASNFSPAKALKFY